MAENEVQQEVLQQVAALPEVKIRAGLLQRDMERYHDTLSLVRMDPKKPKAGGLTSQYEGLIVRCAIKANWFEVPTADYVPAAGAKGTPGHKPERFLLGGVEVGEMEPWLLDYYSVFVEERYKELRTIPKALSLRSRLTQKVSADLPPTN